MKQDKTTVIIWSTTILLVIGMLGAAAYIGISQREAKMPANIKEVAQTDRQSVRKEQSPESMRKIQKKKTPDNNRTAPSRSVKNDIVKPEAPTPEDDNTEYRQKEMLTDRTATARPSPRLDLSGLAGTMSATTKLSGVNNNKMPLRYTCYRYNYSPVIDWSGAPAGTRSFAVFFEKRNPDEDVATNWLLFNIPESLNGVDENIVKQPEYNDMRQGLNDFGNAEYTGPCEPKGKQHYSLRIFALDQMLEVPAGVEKDDLVRAMNGHILDMTEIKFIHYSKL